MRRRRAFSRDVTVAYPHGRDVAEWRRENASGMRPGGWPYGLDELSQFASVSAVNLAPPHRGDIVRRLPERLFRHKDDVLLTWDENAAHRARAQRAAVARFTGAVWVNDMTARGERSTVDRLRTTLRRMDGVWVLSSAQLDPMRELLGPSGPPVAFLPFGIDEGFFSPSPYPERPVVLSVGADRDRDAQTLLSAMSQIARAVPEAEILVQSASRLPTPPGITRIERVSHAALRALYARASVVVVATRPNLHVSGMTVGLEAMASSRPFVATDTPGAGDYFGRETGILTTPSDPAAIADATLVLLRDPDLASRMGASGRREVERRFTTSRFVADLATFTGLRGADRLRPSHGTI